jgi:hypothetical protein
VTRSMHKLGLVYERCENKGEVSTKFVSSSTYKDEEQTLKAKQIPYPPNPKSSFNPKRAQKQTTNSCMTNLDGVYICMFCGRADHLVEFCFQRKRIEKRRFDYARNSYRDEFIDFLPRSYSHAPPRFYSRASPHTSSCALPQFAHGPNHHSYGFGSQENRFEPRCFGYGSRPYRGDCFPRRPGFPAGGAHTHFELRHLNVPHFPRHGSRSTWPNGELKRIVKTSSGRMVT